MIKIGKDEKVILEVRKHWFIFFAETLFLLLLAAFPLGIKILAEMVDISRFFTFAKDPTSLAIAATAIWLLLLWTIFFVIWTNYYLDILILTDKRVIDIEQRGLFSRNIAVTQLEHVEDITTEVHGIIATLLDFGTIHMQTAAESREFVVRGIPHPSEVRRLIAGAHEEAMRRTFRGSA